MGAPGRFVVCGAGHLGALATIALATLVATLAVRRDPTGVTARRLRIGLAAVLPALWLAENVVAHAEGWLTWQIGLPLQLCDVSLMLAFVGLLTLRPGPVEPLYFFALAGTLPSLLTPELDEGFPAFRFLIYFLPHGLTLLCAVLLIVGFRLVPGPGAWWRAFLLLNVLALLVTGVNLLLDTNFLYLRAKPRTVSPFDWFGPWPWYILTLEAVFAAVFFALDLPLRPLRSRWGVGRQAHATSAPTSRE
jgi:hypothetical integral membrane protein (TIGR02206 family)